MTSKTLASYIIHQRQEVDKLPNLPDKLQAEFDEQRFQEQVYHSLKMEGSTVKLDDVVRMS